ncbi:hypothetical protein JMJ55_04575 [Belnapia sp. T6]|uniref:Uncharacterized protein n=1 Tax=Belnapia mucosa TaxID=2804532 RepID=A0ABS1UYQ2_9PROT|nr:hypothetical protein [Belnapia mucosa]MBL6454588.1 hypothetical protein [Belnapia mucosa]
MSMKHSEFVVGQAFTTGHGLWRCTDVGARTVVAIRIDAAEIVSVLGGKETASVVDPRRDPSWLKGPPYALAETVFDEYDFAALRPVAERDVMGWEPERR